MADEQQQHDESPQEAAGGADDSQASDEAQGRESASQGDSRDDDATRALRAENASHRRKAREAQKRAEELEARLKQIEHEGLDEREREKVEAEARGYKRGRGELIEYRLTAAAAGVLAHPSDAGRFVRDVTEDASDDELKAAIAELVEQRPELALQKPATPRIEQGPRNGPGGGGSGDWLRDSISSRR